MQKETCSTEANEWILREANKATIGITEHARESIGEIVYVELPKKGTDFEKDEVIAVIESTKAAGDIYAPFSGKVIATNDQLKENPDLLNQDPEGTGWLLQMDVA